MYNNNVEYIDPNPNSHYLTWPGKVGAMCIGFDTIEFFTQKMVNKQTYLEIGSFDGIAISLYAERYPDRKFYSVDYFRKAINTDGGHFEYFQDNCKNFKNIWLFNNDSRAQLPEFIRDNLSFDIIFIDGDHGYDAVRQDLANAYKLLNANGQIFLHDSAMNGVIKAVAEFEQEMGLIHTSEISMTTFTKLI